MRRQHLLRHNKSGQQPTRILVVDTETSPIAFGYDTVEHELTFGWCAFVRHREPLKWSKPIWHRFTLLDEFYSIIERYRAPKERLLIVSHNAAFDVMVLAAFDILPEHGYKLGKAIIESPPFCCDWHSDNGSIRWLDTLNFYTMSLAQIGESINLPKLDFPASWDDQEVADAYCKRDCEICLKALQNWYDFLHVHDLGVAAITRAGQAFNAYRHRFMTHPILIDSHEKALAHTRSGYYGGRVECFRIGTYKGPLYKLDINSMYPALMAEHVYPNKLVTWMRSSGLSYLEAYLSKYSVCATVTLQTDKPAYPLRTKEALLFPIGRFTTVLSSPELRYALGHGHIESVGEMTVYEEAPIFKAFVEYLYAERLKAKQAGDDVSVLNIKLMMNSLYGKFGQRGKVFETYEVCDERKVGVENVYDDTTGKWIKYRHLGGITQIQMDEPEGSESFPAIAAHVTAYGRMQLWRLIEQAGRHNTYYCDTDALIVNRDGLERLQEDIDADRLGYLKLEQTIETLIINGPKDYAADGEIHLKGIRRNAFWDTPNSAIQEKWFGLKTMMQEGLTTAPRIQLVRKVLKRTYNKGLVSSSGVVSPFKLA